MRIVDLTLPLYDYMPVGNVWAWDVPFQSENITNLHDHGFELHMITMHSEAGTRLMIQAMVDQDAPRVDQMPLEAFVMRPTVVLDVPCETGEAITPERIDKAFAGVDSEPGDAFILRTGHGDDERWVTLGDDYARRTPFVTGPAAERLVEHMKERGSDFVGSDVAYWGRGDTYQLPEWAAKPAWERRPFPSLEAKRYLKQYTRDKAMEDWTSPGVLASAGIAFLGAMCNLGALKSQRTKLIVLPLKIQSGRGATCRVVAVEED
jgi:kynurenine formamidase